MEMRKKRRKQKRKLPGTLYVLRALALEGGWGYERSETFPESNIYRFHSNPLQVIKLVRYRYFDYNNMTKSNAKYTSLLLAIS